MWKDDEFILRLRRIEAMLLKVIILGFLLLVGIQIYQGSGTILTGIEGTFQRSPIDFTSSDVSEDILEERIGALTIEVSDGTSIPGVKVLINNRPVGDFQYREVTLRVKEGDIIELDGRSCTTQTRFKVTFTSGIILWPTKGMEITLSGEVKKVCDVIFRE